MELPKYGPVPEFTWTCYHRYDFVVHQSSSLSITETSYQCNTHFVIINIVILLIPVNTVVCLHIFTFDVLFHIIQMLHNCYYFQASADCMLYSNINFTI